MPRQSNDDGDLMDWHLIRPDGNGVLEVWASKDEIEEYRRLLSKCCEHPRSEIRDFQTANGGRQRKPQCLICGAASGQPMRIDRSQSVPKWDYELQPQWLAELEERRRELEAVLIERTAALELTGYVYYEEYLRSAEWAEKRELVLTRDGGRCQACYQASATEVHHLTYDRIFEEPLFDLVAICRPCHEKLHEPKIAAKAAAHARGADTA